MKYLYLIRVKDTQGDEGWDGILQEVDEIARLPLQDEQSQLHLERSRLRNRRGHGILLRHRHMPRRVPRIRGKDIRHHGR